MDKYLIKSFAEKIYFSKEAADYLGISIQRLNQLVHAGQLEPIKKTSAGALFFIDDLNERLKSLKEIGTEIKQQKSESLYLDTPFMNEVLNYYTIQSFYGYSDKKTEAVFEQLSKEIDFEKTFEEIVSKLSVKLSLSELALRDAFKKVKDGFKTLEATDTIIKKNMEEYPEMLRMTDEAPPYLFARGNIELLKENIVSIVGSRDASEDGKKRASVLARKLGKVGIVVASGLAKGIDTAAHKAAIESGYLTIAVIGTPITKAYPKENANLQKKISEEGLVISQFPPSSAVQRWHFPMRNAVMSGISLATAIMEAGETSGSLKQADYALKQKRLVFIPQSAIDNEKITWPNRYLLREGAVKFSRIDELLSELEKAKIIEEPAEQMSLFLEEAVKVYVHVAK